MLSRCRYLVILSGMLSLVLAAACRDSSDQMLLRIESRDSIVLGEALDLRATGLAPGELYVLVNESIDAYGRLWVSRARFRADTLGVVDPSRQAPEQGSYEGIDAFGLLWSAVMPEPPTDDWQAPEPKDYNEIRLRLEEDEAQLAEGVVRQWIRPPEVRSETWKDGLVAEFFVPADGSEDRLPALVLLGGSGGGKAWASRTAGLIARRGFAALALAYFNAEGLPEHLAQVPIEPVLRALDRLGADPRVDPSRLGLLGYSKGAELALLVASRRSDVRAVVAIAPGSAVFQGFKPPRYPTLSSWSFAGRDLAFVPNAYDEHFFETYDGMYLWYRTLSQHEAVATAAIPVEEIQGDILLLSGVEDRIWPATYMAEQIVSRLYLAGFPHEVRHLPFPQAGHGIAAPPGEPTADVAARLGGTAAGNAAAREQGWRAINEFLSASLR